MKSYGFEVKSVKLVQSYLCEQLQSVFEWLFLSIFTGTYMAIIPLGNCILTRKCIGPYYKPSLYERG